MAETWFLRGHLANARWRLDEAAAHYREGLKLHDYSAGAQMALAVTSLLRLDIPATKRHLNRFVQQTASTAVLAGRSLNPSQTHLGQLLNEYLVDEDALVELIRFQAAPPEKRIKHLLRFVREMPENTPGAIALLIALRQAGCFTKPKVTGDACIETPRIPKKIIQFWDGLHPPDDIETLMETWRDFHPDYVYRRFDDTTAVEYLRARFSRSVLNAYGRCNEPAQRADIFRLAYLVAEGGYYADADDRCIARIDRTIRPRTEFVAFQEEYGTAGNNFIGCIPGHPIISRALSLAVQAINDGASEYLWLCSGPGLLTRGIAQVLAEAPEGGFAYGDRLELLERSELRSIVAAHCANSHKQSKKHWLKKAFESKGRQLALSHVFT